MATPIKTVLFLGKAIKVTGKDVVFASDATLNMTDATYGSTTIESKARVSAEISNLSSTIEKK